MALYIDMIQDGEVAFTNSASSLNEVLVGRLFDRFHTVETARKSTGLGAYNRPKPGREDGWEHIR